jgi:chaperonin cofactor prefoldin
MIYVRTCPRCHETVSFLNDEDTKVCRKCGEVVFNTSKKEKTKDVVSEDLPRTKLD